MRTWALSKVSAVLAAELSHFLFQALRADLVRRNCLADPQLDT
jgi:hypothetical protein